MNRVTTTDGTLETFINPSSDGGNVFYRVEIQTGPRNWSVKSCDSYEEACQFIKDTLKEGHEIPES